MWSWSNDGKRIRLNVNKVRSDFEKIIDGDLTFIRPKFNLWGWEDKERFLRSIIINKEGYIVSCSWPKFGNYGEFNNDTELLNEILKNNGDVRFSHKEDGSLCIRSVINDKVVLRTRGTLYGGEVEEGKSFGERFYEVARYKYPIILNNKWMTDRSMLFEFVSPDNTIIVKYNEPDLIFLGFVMHKDLTLGRWMELEYISRIYNLNLVKLHNLPRDPIKLLDNIRSWDEEGVVVRFSSDQVMVKLKSAHYLAQHRLKFSINYKFVVEFIELTGIKSEWELVDELKSCHYDWEIIQTVLPFYHRYVKAKDRFNNLLDEACNIINDFHSDKDDEVQVKKDLALSITDKSKVLRSIIFSLYGNKIHDIDKIKKRIILAEK
jgi:hypothetical protein